MDCSVTSKGNCDEPPEMSFNVPQPYNKKVVYTFPRDLARNPKNSRGPIPGNGNGPNPDFPLSRPITPKFPLPKPQFTPRNTPTSTLINTRPHHENNQQKLNTNSSYRNPSTVIIRANSSVSPVTIPVPLFKHQPVQVARKNRFLPLVPSVVQGFVPTVNESTKKKSCLIIPTTIGGIRDWDQYKEHFRFHFELVGSLDSAVTIYKQTGKSFLLKDDTATVKCIFYQIDRNLPRVVRGQSCRCVGTFDERNEVVQCYSIRAASNDEIKYFKKRIEIRNKKINFQF